MPGQQKENSLTAPVWSGKAVFLCLLPADCYAIETLQILFELCPGMEA